METNIPMVEAWEMDAIMRRAIVYGIAIKNGNKVDWETGNIFSDSD